MTFANNINSMRRTLNQLMVQIGKAKELIDQSPRPTDAIPVEVTLPFFVIHPDHLDGWKSRVDEETLKRLSLCARPNVFIVREEEIQALPYALGEKELADFRRGKPVLTMGTLHQIREPLPKGGRRKDVIEVALREALAFEVYRRDIELRAIEAIQAKRKGRTVDPIDIPKVSTLSALVWVEGLPAKGRNLQRNRMGDGPANEDDWLAVLAALQEEGRKLAAGWIRGVKTPAEAQAEIIARIFDRDASEWEPTDFDAYSAELVRSVELLMRAVREATELIGCKQDLSQQLRKHLSQIDGRRTRLYDPMQVEKMTKHDHSIITQNSFTPRELAEIAFLADIDPNLLCSSHMLASVEFGIARQLGRWARGKKMAFGCREIDTLSRILLSQAAEPSSEAYTEVHALLADYALELMSVEEWQDFLAALRKR